MILLQNISRAFEEQFAKRAEQSAMVSLNIFPDFPSGRWNCKATHARFWRLVREDTEDSSFGYDAS